MDGQKYVTYYRGNALMVCRIAAREMEQANQSVTPSRDSYVAQQKNLISLFRTSLQPLLSKDALSGFPHGKTSNLCSCGRSVELV